MFRANEDAAARLGLLFDFAVFVAVYLFVRWLSAQMTLPAEAAFWVEWIAPLIPAGIVFVFGVPRPTFEVRWHVDEVAPADRRYVDFNLAIRKQATGAAEVPIAATLVPHYHSLAGWLLALRAERKGYRVVVVVKPNGLLGVKPENRAVSGWVLPGKESFFLPIDTPANGVQGARFSGYLVAKRLQLHDRVEFTTSLRRSDDKPVRFLGSAFSSAKGIEVRS